VLRYSIGFEKVVIVIDIDSARARESSNVSRIRSLLKAVTIDVFGSKKYGSVSFVILDTYYPV